ncbi:MAG: SixA phosphatase family protein, partial [Bdellovibrionales bacterium]
AEAGFSKELIDFHRALTAKGIEDATRLGKIMKKKGYRPDFVHCSQARRVNMTIEALDLRNTRVKESEKLYLGEAGKYVDLLQHTGNQYNDVLIAGHNPAIHDTVRFLAQYADDIRLMSYRPCTLTVLKTNITDWLELCSGNAAVHDIIVP